jgi:hypothetical protein
MFDRLNPVSTSQLKDVGKNQMTVSFARPQFLAPFIKNDVRLLMMLIGLDGASRRRLARGTLLLCPKFCALKPACPGQKNHSREAKLVFRQVGEHSRGARLSQNPLMVPAKDPSSCQPAPKETF